MPDLFTEQERPYLSREKRKKDYLPVILVLLMLLALALMVDFGLKWTVVHAEEPLEMKDMRIYEQYANETLEMCEKYIESRIN